MRVSGAPTAGLPGDEWDEAEAMQGSISASDLYFWTHIEAAGSRNIMGSGYLNSSANLLMHGVLLIYSWRPNPCVPSSLSLWLNCINI